MTATTITTITTMLVQETDKAWALWDGAMHEVTDATTGEITERRHFHWVPKSQATIKSRRVATEGGQPVTWVEIDMPEWLARKAGLLGDDRCRNTGDLFA